LYLSTISDKILDKTHKKPQMKKNKWQKLLVIIAALVALELLNMLNSIKPPNKKVEELLSIHKGVFIMVKSYTDRDREFLNALKEIKPHVRGKASIIVTDKKSGYHVGYAQSDKDLPLLIIFDREGTAQIFKGSIDKTALMEIAHKIATQHHEK